MARLKHYLPCTRQRHRISYDRCRSTHHPVTHRQSRIRRRTQLEIRISKGLISQGAKRDGLIILLHINRHAYLRSGKIIGVSRLIRQEIDLTSLTHIIQEAGPAADGTR